MNSYKIHVITMLAVACLGMLATTASAIEITVGTGGEDYATLAEAVANATHSDIITISAGTYQEVCPVVVSGVTDLTIRAASGAAVTITNDTGTAGQKILVVANCPNFLLQGDANNRMTITESSGGAPVTLDIDTTSTKTIENVRITGAAGAAGNIVVKAPAVFNNLEIATSGGNPFLLNGGSIDDVLQFNNLIYQPNPASGLNFYHPGTVPVRVEFNDSTFSFSGGFPALQPRNADCVYTANNCVFDGMSRVLGALQPASGPGTVILNDCTFQNISAEAFQLADGLTVQVNGSSAASKLDLDNVGALAFGRLVQFHGGGTFSAENVILHNPLRVRGPNSDGTGDITATPTVNLNQCELAPARPTLPWAIYHNDNAGTGGFVLNATNTVIYCDVSGTIHTGAATNDTLNMVHCTVFNTTGGLDMMYASSSDVLTGQFTIFDAAGANSVNPHIALNGNNNLLNSADILDFGGTGYPGDTILGDPQIDATGRLTIDSSIALSQATGSTVAVDIDGDSRPLGGSTPDIGADEFDDALDVPSWSRY